MSFVQNSGLKLDDGVSGSSSFSAASNFTSGNLVIVTLAHYNGFSTRISGVTVAGQACTLAKRFDNGGAPNSAEIWYVKLTSGGSTSFVITYGGGSDNYVTCAALEWSGVSSSPADQSGQAATSTSPSTVTASGANSQADMLIIAQTSVNEGVADTTVTNPSGYTQIYNETDANAHAAGQSAYKVVSASETSSATWTTSFNYRLHDVIATFKLSGSDVSVALTGVSLTTSAGALGNTHAVPLTGVASTTGQGNVTPTIGVVVALTGIQINSGIGTLVPANSIALTGQQITMTPGTLPAVTRSVALSGAASALAAGTLIPASAVPLTGASATGSVGNVSASGDISIALTGIQINTATGLITPSSSVGLTGASTTIALGTVNIANALALTGQGVTCSVGSLIAAIDKALVGISSTMSLGNLTASAGGNVTVALSGQQINMGQGIIHVEGSGQTVTSSGGMSDFAQGGITLISVKLTPVGDGTYIVEELSTISDVDPSHINHVSYLVDGVPL